MEVPVCSAAISAAISTASGLHSRVPSRLAFVDVAVVGSQAEGVAMACCEDLVIHGL